MPDLTLIIALLIALVAGIAIGILTAELRHMQRQIHALEDAQARHLPHKAAESIEDAAAALARLKFELALRTDFVDNALAHLGAARNAKGVKHE